MWKDGGIGRRCHRRCKNTREGDRHPPCLPPSFFFFFENAKHLGDRAKPDGTFQNKETYLLEHVLVELHIS